MLCKKIGLSLLKSYLESKNNNPVDQHRHIFLPTILIKMPFKNGRIFSRKETVFLKNFFWGKTKFLEKHNSVSFSWNFGEKFSDFGGKTSAKFTKPHSMFVHRCFEGFKIISTCERRSAKTWTQLAKNGWKKRTKSLDDFPTMLGRMAGKFDKTMFSQPVYNEKPELIPAVIKNRKHINIVNSKSFFLLELEAKKSCIYRVSTNCCGSVIIC